MKDAWRDERSPVWAPLPAYQSNSERLMTRVVAVFGLLCFVAFLVTCLVSIALGSKPVNRSIEPEVKRSPQWEAPR